MPVAAIDDPALPEVLAELAGARADEMDAGTVNRELSIARKDRLVAAPGLDRRRSDDRYRAAAGAAGPHRALAEDQIAALNTPGRRTPEKTEWKMLYEFTARADEGLCLKVEDLSRAGASNPPSALASTVGP
ncbi:hypothetical protein ACWDX6_21415 [Streptomyces sp. NPDC003027]